MNKPPPKWLNPMNAGLVGGLVVMVAGLLALADTGRIGSVLRLTSYDWAHDLASFHHQNEPITNLVIVYIDEASHRDLAQPFNVPWDRAIHAKLVNRLTADKARATIFDVIFSDPGPDPLADASLAEAIKKNGRIVLAADAVESQPTSGGPSSTFERTLTLPYKPFLDATAKWGFSQLQPDQDFVVREHRHKDPELRAVSLSWAAAELLNLELTHNPESPFKERWLNYYGPPEDLPSISYKVALDLPAGYFRDKIVFVGGRSTTGLLRERRDEFRNPYSTWFRAPIFMPAVEIHALSLLNLIRGDWLSRLSPAADWVMLLLGALMFGYGLTRHSPIRATVITGLGIVGLVLMVKFVFGPGRLWFPWLIIAAVQAPVGLLFSFCFKSWEWFIQKRGLVESRKQAEARIREQAALLDKAQDAIIVHSLDGHPTYWNPGAERLYGWTLAEIGQANIAELLASGTSFNYSEALKATLAAGDWTGQIQQTTKTGRKLTVESSWSLIRDDSGNPKSILVISTDVSERKKLEAQLWRSQRVESIGTLASGIAHDLNNALAPILMASQMLQLLEKDEKKLAALQLIEQGASHGAGMAKQVLTFVRGFEGDRVLLQLKHVLREAVQITKEMFPSSIVVETKLASDLLPVRGNLTQLHQVLLNLFINARDAMPNGGTIKVYATNVPPDSVKKDHGLWISIRICDTGTGMPPEVLSRIFDPFFTTKAPGKGTGLGLSTALGIVKHHGGSIDVSSEPAKGSEFTILLPAVAEAVPKMPPPQSFENLQGQQQLILVIAREPLTRGSIEYVLEQHNYRVIQTRDPAGALPLIQQQRDDLSLVLLDSDMEAPALAAFSQQLKSVNQRLRVLEIGSSEPNDSGSIVLDKPFSALDLLKSVQRCLKGEHTGSRP